MRHIDGTYAATTVPTDGGWHRCDEHGGRAIDLKGTTYCYVVTDETVGRMREARSVGHALGIAKREATEAFRH